MEDCIDRIGNAKFVTKLDLLKGYWQVPLTERASEISAFATPDAFLQYKVLAFGLKNAPATFQRLMNQVLALKRRKQTHCICCQRAFHWESDLGGLSVYQQ